MSSSQHTASKKKPPTTKAKKSTSDKHRFQKVGKIRSKGASNVSTSWKKNTQHHSDSSFQLNPNDDDTISVNSNSTINASIVNAPAILEFDLQTEDIEVEKDCNDAPYNVIDKFAPAIEHECPAPHRKRIQRKVASTVKNANNAKRTSKKPKKKEKQLTRVEKLEMFLGYFDIPKYWIRVILSFLVRENETNVRKCSSQI